MRLSTYLVRAALALGLLALLGAPAPASGGGIQSTYILVAADDASLPGGLTQQVAALGGSITYPLPEIGVAVATSADAEFATSASSIAGLRSVIPDVAHQQEPETVTVTGSSATTGTFCPYDLFPLQWGLDAIDAPEAWATGARGRGARVAVLDTGIDVDHVDLAPNLNLELSRSFIPGVGVDATLPPDCFNPRSGSLHHGSWVAGIIAAADNGIGTIGVAPEAELLALRVCTDQGSCPDSAILAGLVYAAESAVDVINISLQGSLLRRGFVDSDGTDVSAADVAELLVAYTRAFDFAHHQGATIVTIAGNQRRDLDADQDNVQLWAQLPSAIAVAATGPRGWALEPTTDLDLHACYSNYGQSVVDLAAPGGIPGDNINCKVFAPLPWQFCTVVVTLPCFAFDWVVGPSNGGWSLNFGTSAATPHVAGVAALVIGANGGQMNPDVVEAILRASADDLGKPGIDDFYGHGRVNAAKAVGLG